MSAPWTVHMDEMKQDLLGYFLPFVEKNLYCRRLCDYLHQTHDVAVVERMRHQWHKNQQAVYEKEKNRLRYIHQMESASSAADSDEAEQMLQYI